jgi:hypothetical protein
LTVKRGLELSEAIEADHFLLPACKSECVHLRLVTFTEGFGLSQSNLFFLLIYCACRAFQRRFLQIFRVVARVDVRFLICLGDRVNMSYADRDGKSRTKAGGTDTRSSPRLHEDTDATTLRQSILNILNADIAPLDRALA